jgi:hypothetical protein
LAIKTPDPELDTDPLRIHNDGFSIPMFNADLRLGLISLFLNVQDQRWFYALLSVTGVFYLITFICICLSYRHQRSPLTSLSSATPSSHYFSSPPLFALNFNPEL